MVCIYDFQPGHQFMCQRQNLPNRDFGLLSYLALNLQLSQLASAIIIPFKCDTFLIKITINQNKHNKIMKKNHMKILRKN